MSIEPSPATEDARHVRVPGYDVARAAAIAGMVLINFGVFLLGPPRGTPGEPLLRWLAHVPGGRASSLFVTLAGVGIARMAFGDVALARRTLLKRAALLLALGVTNLFLRWWIDILHFYACYLTIAALFFLRASPRALVVSAVALGLLGGAVAWFLPEEARGAAVDPSLVGIARDVLSGGSAPAGSLGELARGVAVGALRDALIDGIHPVVPWLAFLLWGMWLGRIDLRVAAVRRTFLVRALAVFVLTELASVALAAISTRDPSTGTLFTLVHTDWSPGPLYVLSASATATAVIALAHELVERAPTHPLVRLLGNAGQLALSLYLVHAHLAIGIPRFFLGQADAMSVEAMLVYWVLFVVVVLPLAGLYRTRFSRGPVEWVMRRLTGSPEHVAPLAPATGLEREPPRWAWPLVLAPIALLPVPDFVGVAPPHTECEPRRGLEVPSRTPGELTLLCPRSRYAIELEAPTALVLTTRSGLDVYLEVRREGTMIVQDDDSGPAFDSRIEATLGPGRYDVDVRPYSAATGAFVLEIARDPSRAP